MKKIIIVLLIIIYTLSIVGCTKENRVIERIDGSLKTYYKLEDGTGHVMTIFISINL